MSSGGLEKILTRTGDKGSIPSPSPSAANVDAQRFSQVRAFKVVEEERPQRSVGVEIEASLAERTPRVSNARLTDKVLRIRSEPTDASNRSQELNYETSTGATVVIESVDQDRHYALPLSDHELRVQPLRVACTQPSALEEPVEVGMRRSAIGIEEICDGLSDRVSKSRDPHWGR
jgi:hypothetical protein